MSVPFFKVISRVQPSSNTSTSCLTVDGDTILLQSFDSLESNQQPPQLPYSTSDNSTSEHKHYQRFTYDSISLSSTQNSFYENYIKQPVQSLIDGKNATLFLFGTELEERLYTLEGELNDTQKLGIIPRITLQLLYYTSQQNPMRTALYVSSLLV